ncbi:carbonic anhydrase [Streptomyces virginiae]|uniref:carbonic anhydrase n=1 Tax=Streptomyces virginiae TaxID=1961 RepID=UPI0022504DF1|nr:carbonic anhydrase [Streptomyces virginiae]MCX4717448.1 carbonic anhydrase [Streptomyces virginiae]MCX5277298.1 carbonic anhydrase [Streptomyces virginiae]
MSSHIRTISAPHSRRALLRTAVAGTAAAAGAGLTLGAALPAFAGSWDPESAEPVTTPAQALRRLAAGNRRWRAQDQEHPHESAPLRRRLAQGQQPFALVLGCVDSRVPPELVFDQGLGDLLTVRSAGEVLDEAVLGSIAYGVLELRIPLVLVLAHQSCGAVAAAVHADESGEPLPAHVQYLADQIRPSIDHGRQGEARVDATIDAHVRNVRGRLAAEPDLAGKVAAGELAVVAARYELRDQHVRTLA